MAVLVMVGLMMAPSPPRERRHGGRCAAQRSATAWNVPVRLA